MRFFPLIEVTQETDSIWFSTIFRPILKLILNLVHLLKVSYLLVLVSCCLIFGSNLCFTVDVSHSSICHWYSEACFDYFQLVFFVSEVRVLYDSSNWDFDYDCYPKSEETWLKCDLVQPDFASEIPLGAHLWFSSMPSQDLVQDGPSFSRDTLRTLRPYSRNERDRA